MSPNYGVNKRPDDAVPDWLLGGNRKRLVLVALASGRKDGWTAAQLSEDLECGRTTAHEILRALQPLGVLEALPGGGVRLARRGSLARALRGLLTALAPFEQEQVDRPSRDRGRT